MSYFSPDAQIIVDDFGEEFTVIIWNGLFFIFVVLKPSMVFNVLAPSMGFSVLSPSMKLEVVHY